MRGIQFIERGCDSPRDPLALHRERVERRLVDLDAEARAGGDAHVPVRGRGGWSWGGDPDYAARPAQRGWEIERHERGSFSHAMIAHEGDLVLLWMDMFRNRFPYPIAHVADPAAPALDSLSDAARATLAAHATNVAMPYLQNWIRERDDARNGGPGAAGSLR